MYHSARTLLLSGSSNVCRTKFGQVFERENLELISLIHLNNSVWVIDINQSPYTLTVISKDHFHLKETRYGIVRHKQTSQLVQCWDSRKSYGINYKCITHLILFNWFTRIYVVNRDADVTLLIVKINCARVPGHCSDHALFVHQLWVLGITICKLRDQN